MMLHNDRYFVNQKYNDRYMNGCKQMSDRDPKGRKKQETRALVLEAAERGLLSGISWDLVGEVVKAAIRALDGIIGRVDVEDVLGRIFSSFCIGK